jgi:hypothetical protein
VAELVGCTRAELVKAIVKASVRDWIRSWRREMRKLEEPSDDDFDLWDPDDPRSGR